MLVGLLDLDELYSWFKRSACLVNGVPMKRMSTYTKLFSFNKESWDWCLANIIENSFENITIPDSCYGVYGMKGEMVWFSFESRRRKFNDAFAWNFLKCLRVPLMLKWNKCIWIILNEIDLAFLHFPWHRFQVNLQPYVPSKWYPPHHINTLKVILKAMWLLFMPI